MSNRSNQRQLKRDAITLLKETDVYTLVCQNDDGVVYFATNIGLELLESYFAHNPDEWEKIQDMVANHSCDCDHKHGHDDDEIEFMLN
jgi:hypothetical protein